jgi:hypothetical protein
MRILSNPRYPEALLAPESGHAGLYATVVGRIQVALP